MRTFIVVHNWKGLDPISPTLKYVRIPKLPLPL